MIYLETPNPFHWKVRIKEVSSLNSSPCIEFRNTIKAKQSQQKSTPVLPPGENEADRTVMLMVLFNSLILIHKLITICMKGSFLKTREEGHAPERALKPWLSLRGPFCYHPCLLGYFPAPCSSQLLCLNCFSKSTRACVVAADFALGWRESGEKSFASKHTSCLFPLEKTLGVLVRIIWKGQDNLWMQQG